MHCTTRKEAVEFLADNLRGDLVAHDYLDGLLDEGWDETGQLEISARHSKRGCPVTFEYKRLED